MSRRKPQEIRELEFPEDFKSGLCETMTLIVESIGRDGVPMATGQFDIPAVSEYADRALFFVKWIGNINQIINNLNIVIEDMRLLPIMFPALPGSPHSRFYLLVATYFHEFYRFREGYSRALKSAVHRGYLEANHVKSARQDFHDAFGPTIEMRNLLVHGAPIWTGKRHLDLQFVGWNWELGNELRDKETGKVWEMRDVLEEICQHSANAFRDEGNRMSEIQKMLVELFVSIVKNVD